jgi:hypothetical protein
VENLLRRHRLPAAADEAIEALLPFDLEVIQHSSDAFFVYSSRTGFDERKRTLAYFLGIVRRKQKEADAERLRAEHLRRETARKLSAMDEDRRKIEEEKRREAEELRVRPENTILWNCEMLLRGSLQLGRRRALEGMRSGLKALGKLGRATGAVLEGLAAMIRSWGKYREDLKEEVAKLLLEEADRIAMAAT